MTGDRSAADHQLVGRFGLKDSLVFAEKIRQHFKRDALLEAIDGCLGRLVAAETETARHG